MSVGSFLRGKAAAFKASTGVHWLVPLAVAAGYALLMFKLDPFSISKASHERSELATLRVMAPLYKPSGLVTVVYLDDEYIATRGAGWPLPYGEQGRLMRAILAYKPAVLLVDLVYPHRHATAAPKAAATDTAAVTPKPPADDISQLTAPIVKDNGIPIVFTGMALHAPPDGFCAEHYRPTPKGAKADALLDPQSMLDGLRTALMAKNPNELNSQVQLGYIRWSGCGNRYPLLLGGDANSVTPAFAAYRAYCDRHPNPKDPGHCRVNPREQPQEYVHPMMVRAGAFPPVSQRFAFDTRSCQQPGDDEYGHVGAWRKAWTLIQQVALGIFTELRNDKNNNLALPCPALTIVPMSLLEKASAKDREVLIGGRAVVLGANLSGIPDTINTPVHGQIPGVVWHAMALDNLMSLGSNYLAERGETLTNVLKVALVLLLAYLLPFAFKFIEHPWVKRSLGHVSLGVWGILVLVYLFSGHPGLAGIAFIIAVTLDLTKPTYSSGYFIAMLGAVALSGIATLGGFSLGNWFALLLLALAFMHALKPYYHGSERKHFPDKYSVLGSYLNFRPPNKKESIHEHH